MTDEMMVLLSAPLDSKAISKHPTKSFLSSIKAIYVTEMLTQVFGVGGWTTKARTEHVNHESGMVIIHVTFEVPKLGIYYECFGGNDNGGVNNKNFDLADAFKGATTDALTKIGSWLGIGINVFKGFGAEAPREPIQKPQTVKELFNPSHIGWNKALALNAPLNDVLVKYNMTTADKELYIKALTNKL